MAPDARPTPDLLALLRGVSRSFYVSIRLLPAPLRRPIAVAYLLARAADTLADTADLPAGERQAHLETWAAAIDGRVLAADTTGLAQSFAKRQVNREERELILAMPQCLAWLDELPPADREDVRAVLRHITRGQALDIQRFATAAGPRALDSANQLHEYTYLVAGSVGEFWTDLCFRHLPNFATLAPQQMRELGRDFGMALQLVNILRDIGADLAAGRCYLPADELAAAGIAPERIGDDGARLEQVWLRWYARAQRGVDLGMQYADAVNSRRVRAASAMPALLAARTLALLRIAGPQRMRHKVKVPRAEVRAIMARLALTLAARGPMRSMFAGLRWDNPQP